MARYSYDKFLPPYLKETLSPQEQKDEVVKYFLQYANDYIKAAKKLMISGEGERLVEIGALFDAAAILCHYGMELFLKASLLWEHGYYDADAKNQHGHGIVDLAQNVSFLQQYLLDENHKKVLALIEYWFKLRYPRTNFSSNRKITLGSLQILESEIGTEDINIVFSFYDQIIQNLPNEMQKIFRNIDPAKKGNRIFMKKKIEVSAPEVSRENKN